MAEDSGLEAEEYGVGGTWVEGQPDACTSRMSVLQGDGSGGGQPPRALAEESA